MQVFLTLTRRELGTYFVSLTGYITIAAVALLSGLSFWTLIRTMGSAPYQLPVTELFFQNPMFWFILLIANSVITMRLYAHEKYSGTYETLMTTPVGDIQVVSAKFAAAWLFYMIMWLPFWAIATSFKVTRIKRAPWIRAFLWGLMSASDCSGLSSFHLARSPRRSPPIRWWRP